MKKTLLSLLLVAALLVGVLAPTGRAAEGLDKDAHVVLWMPDSGNPYPEGLDVNNNPFIEAIREHSGYPNLEIVIVENGSTDRSTFAYYRELSGTPGIKLVRWKKEFNYSAINNYGVRFATGDYLLFLNNDVRGTISSDWLTEMLGMCMRPDVGAVGARLYYPDNRIQSAGIVVGIGGVAGSMFVDLPRGRTGYMHKAALIQDLSAVTAACMMTKKEVFLKVGGFTEELAVAFNDVDLCLKIGELGLLVVILLRCTLSDNVFLNFFRWVNGICFFFLILF